ncbi:MAG TPA: hypothetical protein VMW89_02150 [Desulfatiglandales bacterium]|nr:hypothetical protein [Desulfatiglandales bacterium]
MEIGFVIEELRKVGIMECWPALARLDRSAMSLLAYLRLEPIELNRFRPGLGRGLPWRDWSGVL